MADSASAWSVLSSLPPPRSAARRRSPNDAATVQADPRDSKYFVNWFVDDFLSRRRATVEEHWAGSLRFLSTDRANAAFAWDAAEGGKRGGRDGRHRGLGRAGRAPYPPVARADRTARRPTSSSCTWAAVNVETGEIERSFSSTMDEQMVNGHLPGLYPVAIREDGRIWMAVGFKRYDIALWDMNRQHRFAAARSELVCREDSGRSEAPWDG